MRFKYNISRDRALSLIETLIREEYAVCLRLGIFTLFCKRGVELVVPVVVDDDVIWIDAKQVLDAIKLIANSTISNKMFLSPHRISKIMGLPRKATITSAISAMIEATFGNLVVPLRTANGTKYIVDVDIIKKVTLPTSEKLKSYLCSRIQEEKQEKKIEHNMEKSELISFHVPYGLLKLLNKLAEERRTTRSELIRKAISELLDKYSVLIEELKTMSS